MTAILTLVTMAHYAATMLIHMYVIVNRDFLDFDAKQVRPTYNN